MPSNERAGRLAIPRWWLDLAFARLERPGTKSADVARLASEHVGRRKPWDVSAISKFKAGCGQTMQMIDGLSFALGIARPFFTAPTEGAAVLMSEIERLSNATLLSTPVAHKLALADATVDKEVRNAIVDGSRARGVTSSGYADSRARGVGVRTRGSRRRGP